MLIRQTDYTDVREYTENDEELMSDVEVVARAKALLDWLKDPAESLTIQTEILDFGNKRVFCVVYEKICLCLVLCDICFCVCIREKVPLVVIKVFRIQV